jgi:hypothetical protein
MTMPHKLNVSWMKNGCKLHFDVIDVSTWCEIMFFMAKILHILCDLSKVTRGICNCMRHL